MTRFNVSGMSCGHCVKAVTQAVQAVAPEAQVKVDLASGEVTVDGKIDPVRIRGAIAGAGYPVR